VQTLGGTMAALLLCLPAFSQGIAGSSGRVAQRPIVLNLQGEKILADDMLPSNFYGADAAPPLSLAV
jgi:hypothetical protein